ncbi:MAG: DMT family transporter [Metallosphaera sp.]|uniref:DMT family transporter n=1 Tax=Metallosphaera sp. TaxID=2020860 RepID=UPI0031612D54
MKWDRAFYNLIGASVLWGTIGVIVQESYKVGATSLGIVLFRTVFSSIITIPYFTRRIFSWKSIIMGLISGIFYEIYTYTIILDGAPLSSFLLYTSPLFVIIFSYLLFKEKITLVKFIGSALVIVALYLNYLGTPTLLELVWGILSGITYAILISFSKYLQMHGFSGWEVLSSQSLWSMLPTSMSILFLNKVHLLPSALGGVYMAIFGTIIPYYLFYKGIKTFDSTVATIISSLEPVTTTILAYFFLNQTLTTFQIIGATIIIISSLWLGILT